MDKLSRVIADKAQIATRLDARFLPFVSQWRDQGSAPSERFLDWKVKDETLGHLDTRHMTSILSAFRRAGLMVVKTPGGLSLDSLPDPATFTRALRAIGEELKNRGLVPGWRNEEQQVLDRNGQLLGVAERALFKALGLRSRAVHVHVENHLGLVWCGVRALTKHENPGMLDNLAAGGVAADESIQQALWRELGEEAGLLPDDFSGIGPFACGELTLSRPLLAGGWHHETVLMFRGRLKAGHRPCNRDGEVAAFQLMSQQACVEAINAWQFTPDAGLCSALALTTNY